MPIRWNPGETFILQLWRNPGINGPVLDNVTPITATNEPLYSCWNPGTGSLPGWEIGANLREVRFGSALLPIRIADFQ